ncbi:MAG: PHP-associated domain-containing protein [Eubacteriales bacterium]|nr:PHP-associated domain-containing protein [Eubacteriales bacterium]
MKLYQFEMHCHTAETSPCGILHAAEVVDGMKEAGYSGTFITDHFYARFFKKQGLEHLEWEIQAAQYLKGYHAAKRRGDEIGVKVFLGLEVQTEDSPFEFLEYGPDERFIRDNGPFYKLSTPEFYRLMHDNGYLVFQAHPYRFGLSPENPMYFDGIEIVNAQPRNESRNKLALKFAYDHDIMVIAGSDVHMKEDIGRSGIMLPGNIDNEKDFVAYMKKVRSPELIVTYGA